MRAATAVLVCASFASAALAFDDQRARTYAFAFAGAIEAQRHCPGLEADDAGLVTLRQAAELGGEKADRAFLRSLFDKLRPDMEREIATKGAKAWCSTAYGIFGPQGLASLRRK